MSERRCRYCGAWEYDADDMCSGADLGWGHRFVAENHEPEDEYFSEPESWRFDPPDRVEDHTDSEPDPIDPTHPGWEP